MFTLRFLAALANLESLKSDLRATLPGVKSSHRCEAIARGLGFRTYAALLSAIGRDERIFVTVNGAAFTDYLISRGFVVTPENYYLAAGRIAARIVLATEPRLTLHGIGVTPRRLNAEGKWETLREHHQRFLEAREEYLGDDAIKEFLAALTFIERVPCTKTIRPRTNSYSLKHIAEKHACTYPNGSTLGPRYISNGALIGAAIYAGFRYKTFKDEFGRESLNVTFNMSERALFALDCEIRPNGASAQERRLKAERRKGWSHLVTI